MRFFFSLSSSQLLVYSPRVLKHCLAPLLSPQPREPNASKLRTGGASSVRPILSLLQALTYCCVKAAYMSGSCLGRLGKASAAEHLTAL